MRFLILNLMILMNIYLYAEDMEQTVLLNKINASATAAGYSDVDATTIGVAQAALLRDILRDMPGVFVGGTNAINQRVYIRGMNQSALNIQIDGARQIGTPYHHTQSLLVDPDILKAVDVSVGTSSIVGSSGALGGSVIFKTMSAQDMLKADEHFGFKLKSGYYSNDNQFQESAMVYGRVSGFDVLGYVNYRKHDFGLTGHNFSFGKKNSYYESQTQGSDGSITVTKTPYVATGQRTGGDGYEINTLLKAGYSIDAHRLELSGEYILYKGLFPIKGEFGSSTGKNDSIQTYTPQIYDRQTYTLHYDYIPSEDFNIKSNAYYSNVVLDKTHYDLDYFHDSKLELWKALTANYGAKMDFNQRFHTNRGSHDLLYGIEYYGTIEKTINNRSLSLDKKTKVLKEGDPISNKPSESANDISAYFQYALSYQTAEVGFFKLVPGVRYEFYNINMLRDLSGLGDFSKQSSNYNHISGAFGLEYKFNIGLGFFTNWTQVFKGPRIAEAKRFAEAGIKFVDTEKLKPESGDNFEGGVTYKGVFGDYRVDFIVKGFYTLYDNLILEKRDKKTKSYTRSNSGAASVYGAEAAIKLGIYDLNASLGYTLTDINYKYPIGNTDKGTGIAPATGDKYTLNLEYFITPIDVLVGWNTLVFANYDKKDPKGKLLVEHKPGYSVSDFYISYIASGIVEGLEINFGIYNLFDEAYIVQTANYTLTKVDYEPGRSYRMNISYQF
ncbi:TonB-dependent receptor [Helicobacter sp. 13S00477-4]|uniref:TonB-dependent receptor domain-containing protein n=1 Tax=Helicobacter sp. 13S00477-4 TaxID=1905759 RepID=UPI000BA657BF|nr:TonB-dependent receptor [Helicobacter sp. 13S00477-4]PAF50332.1 hypothetical protein BKH44_08440 [Helicobacter sp. 13S00477-4]